MKKFNCILSSVVLFTILVVFVSGCKKEDDNLINNQEEVVTTNFKISLKSTDLSRSNYDLVNIDIQKVSIHTSTDLSGTTGWLDMETNAGIYDLMDYKSGNDTIIALDPALQTQNVSQIRLILGSNNSVVVDGATFNLDTQNAQTSGIIVDVDAQLQPGMSYNVVLNFDPDQSILAAFDGSYSFKPVITANVIQQ